MAGGFGTRIQPLTYAVPKPMVPLLNRPMMEHILRNLKGAGITEVVVLLYHMPDVIRNHFGDGADLGMKLHYVLPDDDYGTAGAVKKAEAHIDGTFMIMSGDLVCDFDLSRIISFHHEKKTPVTITLTSVPNPLEFGVVITDNDSRILRFLEKPGWGEVFSDTINTGIYVLEPEVFNLIPAGRNFDFSKDLFPIYMRERIPIYGCKTEGYWRDVGNPDSYREAVRDILKGEGKVPPPGKERKMKGARVWCEGYSSLAETAVFKGMNVVGPGVEVGENAQLEDCVLGPGTVVEDGAALTGVVTWKNVRIGRNSRLTDAVLCDDVQTGTGVLVEKGAIVAGRTEIGNDVTFEKDIMVWPDKKIESGSMISANMVWGDKWKKSVFEGGMVRGNTNVELSPEFAAKMGAALGSIMPVGSAILVSRDYLRASRMLKRAFLGGILSTGVNVHDIKMAPAPVARYKLSSFGEEAGIHFQQGAGSQQTEIAFYDSDGNIIDTGKEKSIERLFFKENFRRMSHSEVGEIQELLSVPDFYGEGFMRALDVEAIRSRRFKVVVDLGYGTTGDYLPSMLNDLGCRPVVLNAYPDERRLMRRSQESMEELGQVAEIVKTLGADAGFSISPGGDLLHVVDDKGNVRPHHLTSMVFMNMLAKTSSSQVKAFLPVTEPRILDEMTGITVTRGKTTSVRTSDMHDMSYIGQGDGRYAFPNFLHAPDAMFAAAKMLELLAKGGARISEAYEAIPQFSFEKHELACPVEKKGLAMRRMSEDSVDKEAAFVDGIQVFAGGGSVLLLPDPHRPVLHLVAEGPDAKITSALASLYDAKVREWLA